MNTTFLIVGGGLSGMLSAQLLKTRNLPFFGLERSDRLGGRFETGHHRVYSRHSVDLLNEIAGKLDWIDVSEDAAERKKGEWHMIHEGNISDAERFYLQSQYSEPQESSTGLVERISREVQDNFHFRKRVYQVSPSQKEVRCDDGTTYEYQNLIWCSPIHLLLKAWQGNASILQKALKRNETFSGGINIEMELSTVVIEQKNTVLLPFRFKDHSLRALGFAKSNDGRQTIQWTLFLGEELFDDREEVAKCVRTFKRELIKEFPALADNIRSEKITYLPQISGEVPAFYESLTLLPDVLYVGPEIFVEESEGRLRNTDLILANYAHLKANLTT